MAELCTREPLLSTVSFQFPHDGYISISSQVLPPLVLLARKISICAKSNDISWSTGLGVRAIFYRTVSRSAPEATPRCLDLRLSARVKPEHFHAFCRFMDPWHKKDDETGIAQTYVQLNSIELNKSQEGI
jgi:hypothetical protein